MNDVVNFILMSRAKNYSVWDTFARDIAINLTGSCVFETQCTMAPAVHRPWSPSICRDPKGGSKCPQRATPLVVAADYKCDSLLLQLNCLVSPGVHRV